MATTASKTAAMDSPLYAGRRRRNAIAKGLAFAATIFGLGWLVLILGVLLLQQLLLARRERVCASRRGPLPLVRNGAWDATPWPACCVVLLLLLVGRAECACGRRRLVPVQGGALDA